MVGKVRQGLHEIGTANVAGIAVELEKLSLQHWFDKLLGLSTSRVWVGTFPYLRNVQEDILSSTVVRRGVECIKGSDEFGCFIDGINVIVRRKILRKRFQS